MDTKNASTSVSRRRFLQAAAGAGGALFASVLAACGSTPPPTGNTTGTAPAAAGGSAGGPTAAAGGSASGPTPAIPPTPVPTPVPDRNASAGRANVLTIWYPYTDPNWEQIWKGFEDSHPDIGIKAVFAANDTTGNAKFFTAVASGTPPDVIWVDGPQVAEWAARGVLEPLDDQINAAGIKPDDFWTPSWNQTVYNNQVWALTRSSDANFGFFWNKDIFKEAGLDPEKPPTTVEEMDQMNEKIAKINNGRIERLGYIPWIVYGSSNSMFTWGWDFGGEFYDSQNKKITANDPNVVKALQWMADFAKKYDPTQISGFIPSITSPGGENGPFTQRKIAMAPQGPWEIPSLKKYAPDLNYGITFLPTGPVQTKHSLWVGGWTIGLPKGAKQKDAAFEFVKWLTSTNEGTTLGYDAQGQFPGYKKSPAFDKIQQSPTLKPFYEILVETQHQRPVMPAQAFFASELQRAVDSAIYGQKTAQQALDDATANTQKELDRIIKEGVQ
jgi:multiple sugar transport system substrate-binding protein